MKTRLLAIAVLCGAAPASAQIVEIFSNANVIAPPASVKPGDLESDDFVYIFAEKPSHTLTQSLAVEAFLTGLYEGTSDLAPSVIPAGTKVASYFFHSDPVGYRAGGDDSVLLAGAVTFAQEILGIMILSDSLDASDSELAHADVDYYTGFARGLEMDIRYDSFTISEDRKTISVLMNTSNLLDQVRVITAAPPGPVPAPGAAALLGLAGLAAARRRR